MLYISALTAPLQRIRSLPELIATFRFVLMEGDGASYCRVSRTARRKSAQQRASLSSFGRKASERPSPLCAGLRRWQPQAVTSSQSRCLGSVSGNLQCCWQSFPGCGSRQQGERQCLCSARELLTPCEGLVSGWPKLDTDAVLPTSSRDWLPPKHVRGTKQARLIIMASTTTGALREHTMVFFLILDLCAH